VSEATWGYGDQPQLSIKWALALCRHVGFTGARLIDAVALMWAESGRYPGAWHYNLSDDETQVLSTDRGLFQVNDYWHRDLSDEQAYKALPNAQYAAKLSNRGYRFVRPDGTLIWMAYGGARHQAYRVLVAAVFALGTWKRRVERVPERFAE
jgi:hypothetical protein